MERDVGFRAHKFFRQTLLTWDPVVIDSMIEQMKKNRSAIENELMTLVFYSKGSLDLNTVYQLGSDQREKFVAIMEKHYKAMNSSNENNIIDNT